MTELIVKHFSELSTSELYEILKTRFEIFVTEQECLYQDLDDKDQDAIVDAIRAEEGNLRYQYFQPLDDPETVLLIDSWTDQAAIDAHHASPMMKQLAELREKNDLHMTVERFVSDDIGEDAKFIRK